MFRRDVNHAYFILCKTHAYIFLVYKIKAFTMCIPTVSTHRMHGTRGCEECRHNAPGVHISAHMWYVRGNKNLSCHERPLVGRLARPISSVYTTSLMRVLVWRTSWGQIYTPHLNSICLGNFRRRGCEHCARRSTKALVCFVGRLACSLSTCISPA